MKKLGLKQSLPSIIALLGIVIGSSPFVSGNLYGNLFIGTGLTLLFISWVVANFQKSAELKKTNKWQEQQKVMIAMSLCVTLGLGMLVFYELKMPKYHVAMTNKELYKVPPQLSKKQLKELGAECNTYGDTLCSHAVFAKIVKLDPRDYYALANLAMAQSHLGFHKYAITNFKRAIANGAKTYDTYKFFGNSLLALKQTSKALKAYNKSLLKKPNQKFLQKKVEKLTLKY